MTEPDANRVLVLGAGPAGLTAAYELSDHGVPTLVLEQDRRYVGGIARTEEHRGFRFDIGGHRFFSKNQEIEDLWTDVLGGEMLTRGRLSRIYYDGRFFDYPIKAGNTLRNLGPVEAARCALSYGWAKVRPVDDVRSYEDWVRNQFGHRLFSIFFKSYTEKVWGISTQELSADWAAQRIKGLDLGEVIKRALLPAADKDPAVIKTLIDRFRYPRLGPGQLWERIRDVVCSRGHHVEMGLRVVSVEHENGRVRAVVVLDAAGVARRMAGTEFISSLPIRELILSLSPAAPEAVRMAASSLGYRDFLTVALVIDRADLFPDNWVYIHDPAVRVGRLQNFKNWSPDMVPDPDKTCLGLEYFCFEGDDLWSGSDEELVRLASREIHSLGLAHEAEVSDAAVVRQPKAYPVYDDGYRGHVAVIRAWLERELPNLHLVGRNGMHKYNNQDHSMLTALLVARNIATGATFDHWKVNADAEYHEEVRAEDQDRSGRQVPTRVTAEGNA